MELLELGLKQIVRLENEKGERIFIPKQRINFFTYFIESKKIKINGYEDIITNPREIIESLGGIDNFIVLGGENYKTFIRFEGITSIIIQKDKSIIYVDGKQIMVSNLRESNIEKWEEKLSEL